MTKRKESDRIQLLRGAGGRPQLCRRRRPFTAARQEKFFATLAATCNVSRACRAAGIGRDCVYNYRRKSAAVRARWAEAVRESYARLELMMLERMIDGTVKTITRADGSVDTVHEYPNALALQLLRQHRETAAEAELEHEPEDVEEVRQRIADRLERLRAQLDKAKAGAAADGDGPRAPDGDDGAAAGDGPRAADGDDGEERR